MQWLLKRLPAAGWKRWLVLAILTMGGLVAGLVALIVCAVLFLRSPRGQAAMITFMSTRHSADYPDHTSSAPAPVPSYKGPLASAKGLQKAADFYRATNIYNVHLRFTANQWKALQPKKVEPVPSIIDATGSINLLNPKAPRNGLAGALGLDFQWSAADIEWGGINFTNAAIRYKGNGTYITAGSGYKRPFKVDLNKNVKDRKLAGRSSFNFGNLSADRSCLSDALAYEFFRDAGAPAPRTAFARVFLTAGTKVENRLLGIYVLVENPDADWAEEQFGVKEVALFKPVTHQLFEDLGTDWKAYERIYDPETKTSPEQHKRVIELAKLVTTAKPEEFNARVGEYLDIPAFARFMACEVIIANYDGILSNGQNFLVYLDPRSKKFGFVPWDQDHSWGEFSFAGTAEVRETASILHPWMGKNLFLERVFANETFLEAYRGELRRLLDTLFVPERLYERIDTLANAIRPVVAEQSTNRLANFEIAIAKEWTPGPRNSQNPFTPPPVHQLKRFIENRAKSVRDQLDSRSEGSRIQMGGPPQRK